MNQDTLILFCAFGGAVIGILGGVVGTWFSIRNTVGPRERAFTIRASVLCWVGVSAFLAALWFTPFPYRALLWLPYMAALPFMARAWNRRQMQIRTEESGAPGGSQGTVV
jgi:hypothetical protein